MNTGEATGIPIIRKLLSGLPEDRIVIVDCPPGSSCAVMESIKDADYCLMVAESTRFGIHNLDMVYNLVKLFKKPHALVVNKDMAGRSATQNCSLCNLGEKSSIEIIAVTTILKLLKPFHMMLSLDWQIQKGLSHQPNTVVTWSFLG